MSKEYTDDDVYKIIEENDVKFIKLQFTDIYGNLKNISILASQLKKVIDKGVLFDGYLIKDFAKDYEPYMLLKPDFGTFVILPWRSNIGRVGRLICNIYTEDGCHFKEDSRYQLKKVIEEAKNMGYTFNVGAECEFFLFKLDEFENPIKSNNDIASYCDIEPLDIYGDVRRQICLALEEMGYEVETSHHQNTSFKHEVGFKYNEALKSADNIMTFRQTVQAIANANNLYATFNPKPLEKEYGSEMHINMSLYKDGKNIFFDDKDINGNGLSEIAYSFIAGIDAMTAINNPLGNFYERFEDIYKESLYNIWSCKNRSSLIRIPSIKAGEETGIELCLPDSSFNPYLVLAACLKAGLSGIKNNLGKELEPLPKL